MKANGIWYLSTTKVKSHKFYHSHSDLGNPLDNEPLFTKGDFIRIDAGGQESKLRNYYKEDKDDDSFVLIPKHEVTNVWFVSYDEDPRFMPKPINIH